MSAEQTDDITQAFLAFRLLHASVCKSPPAFPATVFLHSSGRRWMDQECLIKIPRRQKKRQETRESSSIHMLIIYIYIYIHTYNIHVYHLQVYIYIYAFASYLQHFGSEYVHIYTYIYIYTNHQLTITY